MTAATPGRAAYEAWCRDLGGGGAWEGISRHAAWEAVAQAAIAARQPQPAPGLREALTELVASLDETVERCRNTDSEFDMGAAHAAAVDARQLRQILNDAALGTTPQPAPGDAGYLGSDALAKRYGEALQRIVDVVTDPDAVDKLARGALGLTRAGRPSSRPAPEIAEAMAETARVQDILAGILALFTRGTGGWTARTHQAALARAWAATREPVPDELRRFL